MNLFVNKFTVLILLSVFSISSIAKPQPSHVNSLDELLYGVVLYDFFKEDYFSALIENEYLLQFDNAEASSPSGQVLKGGMLLSYGMPAPAKKLFDELLSDSVSQNVSNRAWYYLARIFYNKSEIENANKAIRRVSGDIPDVIFYDYYYLSTLVNNTDLDVKRNVRERLKSNRVGYAYLLFNLAILELQKNNKPKAINYLNEVINLPPKNLPEEIFVLSDRARNGLAQLSLESGDLDKAWEHLSTVRTTGLYSNRALLAYSWTAISMGRFDDAIPALNLLNARSIALPEVQEARVLLANLYEEKKSPKLALKNYIDAENVFEVGLKNIESARAAIDNLQIPKEFVRNTRSLFSQDGWYSALPEVDYDVLTPFLLDLMSSNVFNEILKELADLYSIEDNLNYWLKRSAEHKIILENAGQKKYPEQLKNYLDKSITLREELSEKKEALILASKNISEEDRLRFSSLQENTEKELSILDSRIEQLSNLDSAYKQPENYSVLVASNRQKLVERIAETKSFIAALEPVMKRLITLELDKHEKRMRYYWAQSKLAKTRLYDANFTSSDAASKSAQGVQ